MIATAQFFGPNVAPAAALHRTFLPNLACVLLLSAGASAWYFEIPLLIAAIFAPALWLAFSAPERLVALLVTTTSIFPVVRLVEDNLNVQQVSTKGAFVSIDDPLIAALSLAAVWRMVTLRQARSPVFPSALAALAGLYPLVIAVNCLRLEPNQSLVSLLAYVKWLQYALLIFLVPVVLPSPSIPAALRLFRRSLVLVLVLSAAFASYEMVEALRRGTYTSAARFPRASAFFGTLNPLRFGASEDPVNFGCLMATAGSIAFAYFVKSNGRGLFSGTAGAFAAALGVFLSVSRTPALAAAAAFFRIQRIRSSRILLVAFAVVLMGLAVYLLFPSVWESTLQRFEAIADWNPALESSASSRITIALNAPVFTIDSFWIAGHGHSSYRFVAEEHLSKIMRGVSRSLYNFLLTVWYDAGAAGTFLWIALFVQLSRRFRRIQGQSRHPEIQALALGLSGALWGLATSAMFGETPYNWRVMGFFYAAAGVCLAAERWERRMFVR